MTIEIRPRDDTEARHKLDELADALQVCLDSGAKIVLLPITSAENLCSIPAKLVSFLIYFLPDAVGSDVYNNVG